MKAVKWIALAALLAMTGCAPYKVSVFGKSGAAFTAPNLCQALIACMNSSESACYYDRELIHDLDGKSLDESSCKEVKK